MSTPPVSEPEFRSFKENVGLFGGLHSLDSQFDDNKRKKVMSMSDEYLIRKITKDKNTDEILFLL